MKLSIIIPSYNSTKTLINTIKSIYDSNSINKYNFEIIVVDDMSSDDSVSKIRKRFPTVKLIVSETHGGASKARNLGIKEAKGTLLLFIDSDAWFNKSTLESMITKIDEEVDIIFPKIIYENGHILYPVLEIEKRYPHISCCFLIKKNSLEKLDEHFDEYYETYLEDYDFFIRCKLAGLKAKYVEDARVIHCNKEEETDYSQRYYLEIRNMLYGKLKFGDLANKSKLYNPFTLNALFKAFFCGIANFAWFNWYGYDRISKEKKSYISKNNNILFQKNRFMAILLFFKALKNNITNKKFISKKNKTLLKFYTRMKNS